MTPLSGLAGAVLPARVLAAPDDLDARVELACLDGYGLFRGAVVQDVPYGEGRILLSTLRFDADGLEEPAVRRLLENLVRWAADVAGGRAAPDVPVVASPTSGVASVGRDLWRIKIFLGLAERLAIQQVNGRRPVRRELEGLPFVVAEASAALDDVVAGAVERGAERLTALAERVMSPDHERFLRKEVALSEAFFTPEGRTGPRGLAENIRVGAFYARALETMRDGRLDEALDELEQGLRYVESIRADPATR